MSVKFAKYPKVLYCEPAVIGPSQPLTSADKDTDGGVR